MIWLLRRNKAEYVQYVSYCLTFHLEGVKSHVSLTMVQNKVDYRQARRVRVKHKSAHRDGNVVYPDHCQYILACRLPWPALKMPIMICCSYSSYRRIFPPFPFSTSSLGVSSLTWMEYREVDIDC
jgi:hypothetical protein